MRAVKIQNKDVAEFDQQDFDFAKRSAETLHSLFEKHAKGMVGIKSKKNDYAGFILENRFEAKLTLNAIRALANLAEVAYKADGLAPTVRSETINQCVLRLGVIVPFVQDYMTQSDEKEGGISYNVGDIADCLTEGVSALQNVRRMMRVLKAQ